LYFVQLYRDKKVVGVFVRFRAALCKYPWRNANGGNMKWNHWRNTVVET
jgi:hypothetical protein